MVPLEEKRLKPKFVSSRDFSRTAEPARRQRLVSCMALKETPHETGASYENAPEIGQFDQREQRVSKELVAEDR